MLQLKAKSRQKENTVYLHNNKVFGVLLGRYFPPLSELL